MRHICDQDSYDEGYSDAMAERAEKYAKILQSTRLLTVETLPNGVMCAQVRCEDFSAYVNLPEAIEYEDHTYGRTGWNSDLYVAYYRTDSLLASPVR